MLEEAVVNVSRRASVKGFFFISKTKRILSITLAIIITEGDLMTTIYILESIQNFSQNNVCNEIKLKKPSDKNVNKFELVNPNVFI